MKELSPFGRDLVSAGRQATDPSEADKERNLTALRAQLAAGAAPTVSGLAPPPVPPAKPIWLLVSGAAVGGGLVASLLFLWGNEAGQLERDASPPPTEVEQAALPPAGLSEPAHSLGEAVSRERAMEKLPLLEPSKKPPKIISKKFSKTKQASASVSVSSELAEEVALLSKATSALRSGRAQDALGYLSEHQRRFPRGALSRERRSARAQALCQLGRKDEAQLVLKMLPASSPLGARARRACKFD